MRKRKMVSNSKEIDSSKSINKELSEQPEEETIERLTKQIAKGGGIAFGGSVIGKVATFGLHILLGRVLGPGAYGLYALGTSVTGIAQSIASLGLNQGVVRFCAMYRGEGDNSRVKGTILSALAISLVSSVLIAAILFALSGMIAQKFFHEQELTWVLRVFAIALPFYVLLGITTSFAQSFRRIEIQQGVQNIFKPLANLALVGIAFLLDFQLAGAIWGFLLSGILSAGVGLYLLWKIFPEVTSVIRPTFDQVNKLVRFSLPMMFVAMSYFLALRTDRIMLGVFGDAEDVGIYNAAANVAFQLTLIHASIVSIFMPIISDVYNKQRFSEMKDLYNTVKRWSSYGTLFLILPIIFYPKLIMSIYGSEYVEGWGAIVVLSLAYIALTVTGPTGVFLQMTGRQNLELFNGIMMLLMNILFNYLLIPRYSYLGAAIATLLAYLIVNCIHVIQIYKLYEFHPFDSIHIRFIFLALAGFGIGVVANIFTSLFDRLFFLFLITGVVTFYSYITRTEQDKNVWKALKLKFIKGEQE